MTMQAGLWIDHRKAVIVMLSETGETTLQVDSDVERHVRFSGAGRAGSSHESASGAGEDTRDRHFEGGLAKFYDAVITCLSGAEHFLVMGPGEAKEELKARLEHHGLSAHLLAVETVDKMTDHQIAALVRERLTPLLARPQPH